MSGCEHCVPCALERIHKTLARNQRSVEETLQRMELAMANEVEQLTVIKARLADVHADVKARLDEVRAEVSPQGQAALDEVVAAIDTFDAEIGDADGSDVPPTDPGAGGAGGDSAGVPA